MNFTPSTEMTNIVKLGRPPHVPTDESRDRVATAAGCGTSHEEIAVCIGISRETLEKYYAHELTTGAWQKREVIMKAIFDSAAKGSVAAAKLYMELQPKNPDAPPATERLQPPLGKKEQANEDAKTAASGTSWATLLDDEGPRPSVQ